MVVPEEELAGALGEDPLVVPVEEPAVVLEGALAVLPRGLGAAADDGGRDG